MSRKAFDTLVDFLDADPRFRWEPLPSRDGIRVFPPAGVQESVLSIHHNAGDQALENKLSVLSRWGLKRNTNHTKPKPKKEPEPMAANPSPAPTPAAQKSAMQVVKEKFEKVLAAVAELEDAIVKADRDTSKLQQLRDLLREQI